MPYRVGDYFERTTNAPRFADEIFADLTARDAYGSGLRFEGMIVYVAETALHYALKGGTDNTNWEELSGSGGGILSVADNTARDAIVSGDRYDGLMVYVQGTKLTWQLQGGIANANYVLIDTGLAVSATQSLAVSTVITLAPVMRQRVKIKAASSSSDVTLPNGTIDGQMVTVQGDDDSAVCTIANGGNVFQNADLITFTKFYNVTYCWDLANSVWVQIGGM